MDKRFGIDVSHWQGKFDFKRAKSEGVQFAILKIGGGDNVLYNDVSFEEYYQQCKEQGIPVGCYFFGHALNQKKALEEAQYWCNLMKGKQFDYPVFYDVEGDMLTLTKRQLTDIIKTVCDYVEEQGYWVGIYASVNTFNKEVYDAELKDYTHWVARYSVSKPELVKEVVTQMWQFGGTTNLLRSNKIAGKVVDQNYCYVDFPTLIKEKGFNGFTKSSNKKSNLEIAKEVIKGKWGNNPLRAIKLRLAGYDPKVIQVLVNDLLKK